EPGQAATREYEQFWADLAVGKFRAGEFKRVGKGGKEVWLQASYNPIFDANGKPYKVVKFASDVTQGRMRAFDHAGQIAAIQKSQAVIEFGLDGTVKSANETFLALLGYAAHEVVGRHHRMFCDPAYVATHEYARFWEELSSGTFRSGEFKRLGKN